MPWALFCYWYRLHSRAICTAYELEQTNTSETSRGSVFDLVSVEFTNDKCYVRLWLLGRSGAGAPMLDNLK